MSQNAIASNSIEINHTNANSFLKLVVFEIGKLTLAIPVKQVQKVVPHTAVHGSGLSHVNLTHLGDQEVAVIDLHQKLFKINHSKQSDNKGYFIITKKVIGEPLGIMVAQTPILLDVPLSQIRTLPQSYRQADTLEIASHVAVIPQENNTSLTVFILDLEKAI